MGHFGCAFIKLFESDIQWDVAGSGCICLLHCTSIRCQLLSTVLITLLIGPKLVYILCYYSDNKI